MGHTGRYYLQMGWVTEGFRNYIASPVASALYIWPTKERMRPVDLGKPTQYLLFIMRSVRCGLCPQHIFSLGDARYRHECQWTRQSMALVTPNRTSMTLKCIQNLKLWGNDLTDERILLNDDLLNICKSIYLVVFAFCFVFAYFSSTKYKGEVIETTIGKASGNNTNPV